MQKLINVLALTSFVVSASVVAGAAYLYQNKEALQEQVKERIMAEVGSMVKGQLGSVLFGGSEELPGGDLPDPTRMDETGAIPLPVIPFGG